MTATISGSATSTLVALTTTGNTILGDASTDTLNVGNGGLVKDASGNVGIGTSSPVTKLQIKTQTNGNAGFQNSTSVAGGVKINCFNDAASVSAPFELDGSTLQFNIASIERARIDSSGNLLVGTTSATAKLSIDSGSAGIYGYFNSANANGGYFSIASSGTVQGDIGTAAQIVSGGATTDFGINARGSRNLILGTNNAERMRLNSAGELAIGKTQASETASTGSGYGFASPTGDPFFSVVNASATAANACIYLSKRTTGGIVIFQTNDGTTNITVGTITTAASSTAYNTSSDYRLKHDIAPMTGALSRVALLKPVTYKWNVDNADGEGFIAHELAEVVPDAVAGKKDAVETVEIKDADGNVTGTEERPVYQGIDTSFLVAMLTAAIQEQQALITSLTSRITALESI
jgi:hypothetical protein